MSYWVILCRIKKWRGYYTSPTIQNNICTKIIK
nr:MAG TPA: hypothetical protein [Caudoviricetes sp.]